MALLGWEVLHRRQTSGLNNLNDSVALITVWRDRILSVLVARPALVTVGVPTADRATTVGASAKRAAGRGSRELQQILQSDAEDIHSCGKVSPSTKGSLVKAYHRAQP